MSSTSVVTGPTAENTEPKSVEDTGDLRLMAERVQKVIDQQRRDRPILLSGRTLGLAIGAAAVVTAGYVVAVTVHVVVVRPVSLADLVSEGIAIVWMAVLVLAIGRVVLSNRSRALERMAEVETKLKEILGKHHYQLEVQLAEGLEAIETRTLLRIQATEAKLGDLITTLGERLTGLHEETQLAVKQGLDELRRELGADRVKLADLADAAPRLEAELRATERAMVQALAEGRQAGEELREHLRDEVTRMLHVEAAWLRQKAEQIVELAQVQMAEVKEEAFADGYVRGVADRHGRPGGDDGPNLRSVP